MAALFAAGVWPDTFGLTAAAMSLFYIGGMFLNDAFDAPSDAARRDDRPIPAGDVSRAEVFVAGFVLLLGGELLLIRQPHPIAALGWGLALAGAVTYYDFRHKGRWFGPLVMGLCRALIYVIAAAGATGAVSMAVVVAAVVMWAYVIGLTVAAKAANLGYAVPWLIAGICLVDAVTIAMAGDPNHAVIAATGFVLTLLFQRVVPGT
jgi:4-hydroxybenzoate polyprenyltransferase